MDWEIKQSKRNYDGHFKVDQLIVQHELFSGGVSKELVRERVSRQNAVAVLPYDPNRDEVVLVEQFRVGATDDGEADSNPWLIEIIAGLVEEGEQYEAVAVRESLEEANCIIEELHHVSSFLPSPGGFSEYAHVYIANTNTEGLGGVCGLEEEGEDIRVHVVSADKAIQMLHQGEIRSAIPMITMYNFILLREELRERWSS